MKRMTVFPYYGGKNKHLDVILPQLDVQHKVYVEPFCGSCAIAINKPPASSTVCSDKNGDVVNFFKVLREQHDEFIRQLKLTPHHELELKHAWEQLQRSDATDMERARCFYIQVMQGRSGFTDSAVFSRSSGRNGSSRNQTWVNKVDTTLPAVVARLRRIEFLNQEYHHVLERNDAPHTLFYLDPPYLLSTRNADGGYRLDNSSEEFHEEFLDRVKLLTGKVAISGYPSELYEKKLRGWARIEWKTTTNAGPKGASDRTEVLWRNYELPSLFGDL